MAEGLGEAVAQLAENAAVGGRSAWTSALRSLGKLLLVAVLCGMLQGIRTAAGQEELPLVTMAGALGMTGVLLIDLSVMMRLCQDTLAEVSKFYKFMLPLMAASVTVTGATTAAAVMQGVTMFSFDAAFCRAARSAASPSRSAGDAVRSFSS